jgi:transcriptional regulator with XRE-family HTH domain
MSTVRHKLGKTIRRLRTDAGYSQEGFADACKFHRTYIGAMDRGEKNLTTDSLGRIAKTLKLSIFELFREAEREF